MYLSVKEAAELTGKSATTIYRLCNKRINTEFVKKEDNKFLIDKEFLIATYPLENIQDTESNSEFDESENDFPSEQSAPIVLEIKNVEKPIDETNTSAEPDEIKKGTNIEFSNEHARTYYQSLAKPEVMVGVSVSILIVVLFIYILSL